jgi:hypothetical protein
MKNSKTKYLVVASVGFVAFSFWMLKPAEKQQRKIASVDETEAVLISSLPAPSGSDKKDDGSAQQVLPPSNSKLSYQKYFESMLAEREDLKIMHQRSTTYFPQSTKSHQLAAMYLTTGLILQSDPEFSQYMMQLSTEIDQNSLALYGDLKEVMPKLKDDPFAYQMAMNLSFNLKIDPTQKAELLGNSLDQVFKFDNSQQDVSADSANISSGLILMKQSGVSYEVAEPYLIKGYEANRNDDNALSEYLARVQAYYPEFDPN